MQGHAALARAGDSESDDWSRLQEQQHQAALSQTLELQRHAHRQLATVPLPDLPEVPHDSTESPPPSATSNRSPAGTSPISPRSGPVARAVTPDRSDAAAPGANAADWDGLSPLSPRELGYSLQPGSPGGALSPAGGSRRQGMVFNDTFAESYDGAAGRSPTVASHYRRKSSGQTRPRTRTIDTSMLLQRTATGLDHRLRIGSLGVSASQPLYDGPRSPALPSLDTIGHSSLPSSRYPEPPTPSKTKEKRSSKRSLRIQPHPPSPGPAPILSPVASVDSLPSPVMAKEPARLMYLIKSLKGRMRGEIEYQADAAAGWKSGFAYVDDERGFLMCNPAQNHGGAQFVTLIADLRGCRVLPVELPDADFAEPGMRCLELVTAEPQVMGESILLLRPAAADEWNLWLAALLSWQQVRPMRPKLVHGSSTSLVTPIRPGLRRQGHSDDSKSSNIIKVGTIMLWDKGPATMPRDISHRSSTRDPHSPVASWRGVSCILHENGEFKLLMENDVTVLSVIELSQLSRNAIQQLDHTVLDEKFCIAIFPLYASSATQLSIFRPVYLSLDSRVSFEVWFVLLRAFAVPDVYRLGGPDDDLTHEIGNDDDDDDAAHRDCKEIFRIEKKVVVRVTEAKIKARPVGLEPPPSPKLEQDPLVGNYLAEVMVDGEMRARTTTKTATKNPFWREDCEFEELPPTVTELTVILKSVDGDLEGAAKNRPAHPRETLCGRVDIALDKLERGKDHEEWREIVDERQVPMGSMLIKVSHVEIVALQAKEYEPLSEILHRFPSGLTTMISAALPGQLRRLSETFLNIFQASGSASDWLTALVEDEIDGIGSQASIKKFRYSNRMKSNESTESAATDRELLVRDMSKSLAGEANLLFRGNSLLTQSLEFHMRRLGTEYLGEMLRRKIGEIDGQNLDCEVDPSRLPQNVHGSELEHRWSRLILATTEVWQCIASSDEQLPAELRHILKFICGVAEDRYGDFLRTVTYTAVSGFLFLRFICPAILSPKLFGLTRDHPRPQAQRTLTLIAKVLQKLANMSTFGKREEWMEPMNKFLTTQRVVFRDFIDRVVGIPADRAVQGVPASYSTPITIMGRLGPGAREGFPTLPYLIDPAKSFASLVKLWVDARPTNLKDDQAEGDLVRFDEICHGLQKRAEVCLAKVETTRAAEVASRGAEKLAETMEQANLIEALSVPYGHEGPPGSSGSDGVDELRRCSDEGRRPDGKKSGGLRYAHSIAGGPLRARNGKVGRNILSGIMRMGSKAEGHEPRHHK
ncbi:GTPase activating protein [Drechmeria coniospora]|uniref:GTPase activating protein n=1 Tax=Drechmeria coniospora TaxID=98403 RepID=A0A151GTX6_DRECN|nr:GTPase activating protein [Drechmeria coniospora]KYK60576.1 GTPase activating protein [Drechmeria coniospora]